MRSNTMSVGPMPQSDAKPFIPRFARFTAFAFAAALVLATGAYGQSERGNISGTVTDPAGAAIAGANVVLTNIATNASATAQTSSQGEFNLPNLLPGNYRLEVTATGFKRFLQNPVVLTTGNTVRIDAQMQLGQVSESVEVSANAIQVQTDNAKVSTAVQNKLVDELPLVVGGAMRSPFNLVSIVAEAKISGDGNGQRLSLGGGQAAQWDATLDGHSVGTNRSGDAAEAALNTPSVEALTEFAVDTNGFKAEYGQAGGGIMTFTSKSGTNEFHGSAYNFLRNDKLDARGFFARTRSVYRQNNFGATLGGPVWIPKLYDGRNKTFFFFAFEGFRNRVGANDTILTVPTPEMYRGDFSNWVNAQGQRLLIYDPATTRPNPNGSGFIRDPFPNNQIPVARFSALTRAILPFAQGITPNRGAQPGTLDYIRNNYIVSGGTTVTPTDKWSVKGDQLIGNRQRVALVWNSTTYRNTPGAAGPPGLPDPLWTGQIQAWDTEAWRVSHDFTLTPTLLNHFSWSKNYFIKNSYSIGTGQNWRDKVCMKNVVDCNVNFPQIRFLDSQFTNWGAAAYNGTEQPGWGLKNDLSWVRGQHSFKFGYQFQMQNADGFGQQDISGRADFSFLGTSVPGQTNQTSGSAFASFLLGDAHFGRTETIRAITQNYPYHGFYAQDDWRITRKLTLNVGLRFDVTMPPTSDTDTYSDFNPDVPNPGANGRLGALWFAGFGEGRANRRSLVDPWYGGWGPRIGIAYALNDKTTIRTAYGRSFSRVTAVQGSGHFAGFIGQYEFPNGNQGVTPTFNLDQGLPAYRLPPSIDPSFSNLNTVDWWQGQEAVRAPESNSWTFNIQRQFGASTVIEVGYNGTSGSHLQTGLLNYNQVPTAAWDSLVDRFGATQASNILRADMGTAAGLALAQQAGIAVPYPNFLNNPAAFRTVAQALRPYPQFGNIVTGVQNGDKSGHSSYHALVIKADRRLSRGLTFQWNYLFSKLLTDSDSYFAAEGAAQDHYNRRLEKSIGQYDQTHSLKLATIYELPFGAGKRWLNTGFLNQVLGGWRVSAIQVYSSGFPVGLIRNSPFQMFTGNIRPVIDSYENWQPQWRGEKFDPAVDRFIKPISEFPAQPIGFGNATRYNPKLRTFANNNENISLAKTFFITERFRLDLRGEAFNLLNRTIFRVGDGSNRINLNAQNLGQVTEQLNAPRQMQVALKLYW
jgi:hypothetical protein